MSESDSSAESPEPNPVVKTLQVVTPAPIRRNFAIKFGLVLLVMALSIGAIGLFATNQISKETKQNVKNEYRNVAKQEADIIHEWVQRNRLSARLLSENPVWGEAENLELALEREAAGLGADLFEMHLIDNENQSPVVAASTSMESGASLSNTERSWVADKFVRLQNLQTDDVYLQHTYQVGSEYVVGFVSPTSARQNRYLLIEVSTSQIRDSLQGSNRAEGGFTQVVDTETNRVMIDELGNETLATYAESQSALRPIQRGERLRDNDSEAGVIARMEANSQVIGQTYTVGYAPVDNTHWVVVTHAPQSSVFGFVQTISNFGLIATLAAVLLIGIVGTGLGYSTSRAIDRLTAKTEEMREGNLDVTLQTSRIDNIGRLYDGFAEMRDALNEQIQEAERARKEAEVSRAEAEEMSNYLQDKAEEYSEIMQQCAAGDLTQRMTQDGENDSMDQIAAEFNDMIEELEKTTGQLKSYVDEVEQAGAEVEESATTVREASEQVADSIQKIAVDSENQKEQLQSISETMDDISAQLQTIAAEHDDVGIDEPLDRIQEIAGEVNEIAQLSEEMQSETGNVSAAAEEQAAELNEVSERANDLQRYAQPLRDILQRFETEAEHEFVFSVGPTGGGNPSAGEEEDDEE